MSDPVNVQAPTGPVVDVRNGETPEPQQAPLDGTPTTPEAQPKKGSVLTAIGNFLAGAWIFIVGLLIWLYNSDISPRLRTTIVVGIAVLLVVGIIAWSAWSLRFKTAVLKATAVVFLLGLVGITALLPVIFLGESDRILLLKLGAIAFLALFPGLLYLQFVAAKAETLRVEYIVNLHRLRIDTYSALPCPPEGSMFRKPDDTRTMLDDPDNLYLQKFNGIYGLPVRKGQDETSVLRRTGGSLLPIGLCTVLLAVGWALMLQPEPIATGRLLNSVTLSGRPLLPVDALRFGFLGAYVFILEVLTRRYFQDDLKTGAYLNGATRILITALLITALHQVWPDTLSPGQELAFAFVIGVFPIVGLKAIQSLIALPLRGLLPSLKKEYPLSDLDGLNIWYESRLLEEGIEDMQNLATANIVDVMLRTRVPVDRLVDWIDQAILDLRVKDGDSSSNRQTLRKLGIRTATDLEDALRPSVIPGGERKRDPIEPEDFLEKMRSALNGEDPALPSVTVSVWKTLAREPNLYHVRKWKEGAKRIERASSPGASEVGESPAAGPPVPQPVGTPEIELEGIAR